jgi:sugar O-acyltransferase (sialic acid O-acetyltransferase NeuD family)
LSKQIIVVGAGGMGREIASVIQESMTTPETSYEFKGFVAEDIPNSNLISKLHASYLGNMQWVKKNIGIEDEVNFIVGIGNGHIREKVETELENSGYRLATVIHKDVHIGKQVEIGVGTFIAAGCVLTTNIHLGKSVQLNIGCLINHEVFLGDYVTLSPGVCLTGNVTVGESTTIFTNSTVLPGIEIGSNCTIGAGSTVVNNIESGKLVKGTPAL